jgi:thiol-disulfide isomerase/thioredoxin
MSETCNHNPHFTPYLDWCGPCKLILPELIKLSAELESKGGQVSGFGVARLDMDGGVL